MGERGEAGEASSDRPTGPIGEHGTALLLPRYFVAATPAFGDDGGRIAALRRSPRGVIGDRSKFGLCGDWEIVNVL